MADEEPKPLPEPKAPPDPLTPIERGLAVLFGVGALVLGAVATFVTSNDGGTVALLAAGTIFLLMAVAGVPITRAKFGDSEVNLAERKVGRAVISTLERADPEDAKAKALANALLEDPAFAASLFTASPVVAAQLYENEVLRAIQRIRPKSTVEVTTSSSAGVDLVVTEGDNYRVGVDTRYRVNRRTRIDDRSIYLWVPNALRKFDRVILVTNAEISRGMTELLESRKVRHVIWRDGQDDARLRTALDWSDVDGLLSYAFSR